VSVRLHAPAALPPVPNGYKAGWTSDSVWRRWQREKYLTYSSLLRLLVETALHSFQVSKTNKNTKHLPEFCCATHVLRLFVTNV